ESKRHLRGGRHLVDHPPGVDMEEFEAPVLADTDVAVDELLLGKEHGLAVVVVGSPPTKCYGVAHGGQCIEHKFASGFRGVVRGTWSVVPLSLGPSVPRRHPLLTAQVMSRAQTGTVRRLSPGGSSCAPPGPAWAWPPWAGPSGSWASNSGRARWRAHRRVRASNPPRAPGCDASARRRRTPAPCTWSPFRAGWSSRRRTGWSPRTSCPGPSTG